MLKVQLKNIYLGSISRIVYTKTNISRKHHWGCCSLEMGRITGSTFTEPVEKNCTLLKVSELGAYVSLDSIHSIFDLLEIKLSVEKDGAYPCNRQIMGICYTSVDSRGFYVDGDPTPLFPDSEVSCSLSKAKNLVLTHGLSQEATFYDPHDINLTV